MKIEYQGKTIEITKDTNVIENFRKEIEASKPTIIACKINNEVKNLETTLQEGDKVELLEVTSKDGRRIYTRGLLFIMSKAFHELYPELSLNVNYQLSNSMLCEITEMVPTEEMIQKVKQRMQELIEKQLPIKKKQMPKEEAICFMEKENTNIGKSQLENVQRKMVSLYFCEDYYNYFFGVMPIHTGYIKLFDIMKYQNGFLVRYPSKKEPNIIGEYKEGKKLYATLEEYDDILQVLGVYNLDKINSMIRRGKGKELILWAEALHEKKISQIATTISENKEKKVILIAGPSSSGKTTFAKRLGIQLRLSGIKTKTISVDDYFVEREQTPKDENGKYNFEALEAIDLPLFNDHISRLLRGEEVIIPTFNFKDGHKYFKEEKKMKLEKDEVLVFEGIHCLNDKLTESIPKEQKFKIYISALTVLNIDYYNRISTTDTRIIRRTVRDNNFRGYDAKKTLENWDSVTMGEEKNIFPYQEEADVMFNTSLLYEINCLKQYALPLYEKIGKDSTEYAEAKRLVQFLKYFETLEVEDVPKNSLLREFIGGSIFGD